MTDSTDRVEALERRVADLEATVTGLTEELVDRTERIRTLEAAVGADPAGLDQPSPGGPAVEESDAREGTADATEAEPTGTDATAGAGAADSDTGDAPTGEDDAEGSEPDDIIVA